MKKIIFLFLLFVVYMGIYTPANAAQYLLVSDYTNHRILRYDPVTLEFIDEFASGGGLNRPFSCDYGADGNLYVSSRDSNQILRYDGKTGEFIDEFASTGLSNPHVSMFGPDGNFYVANRNTNSVLRFNAQTGELIDTFTSGGNISLPIGIVFGPDSNLYVSSGTNGKILRYDGSTGNYIDEFAIEGISYATQIAFGPDGNFYVANTIGGGVDVFDGTTGDFISELISTSQIGAWPEGLTFGFGNNLYVSGNGTMVMIDIETGEIINQLGLGEVYGKSLYFYDDSLYTTAVPEPATMILLTVSTLGFFVRKLKK